MLVQTRRLEPWLCGDITVAKTSAEIDTRSDEGVEALPLRIGGGGCSGRDVVVECIFAQGDLKQTPRHCEWLAAERSRLIGIKVLMLATAVVGGKEKTLKIGAPTP